MQASKTHEQQLRMLERKPDVPDRRQVARTRPHAGQGSTPTHSADRSARQSEFPISRRGMHQEDRAHNKHHRRGQSGHKPQHHRPAEQGGTPSSQ